MKLPESQTAEWLKYGKSKRYYIWRSLDAEGYFYNVTALDFPPTTNAGYRVLESLLTIKNELGGYAPVQS